MSTIDPVINFETLLQPISDAFPCGERPDSEELLAESLLQGYLVRAEQQIKTGIELELQNTINDCIRGLQSAIGKKAKEYPKLKFLMLFLMWRYQFAGLRDGVLLWEKLQNTYGSQMHPLDFEERLSVFRRQLPLFSASSSTSGYFAWLVLNRLKLDDSAGFQIMHLLADESGSNADVADWIRRLDDNYLRNLFQDLVETYDRMQSLNTSFVALAQSDLANALQQLENQSTPQPDYNSEDPAAAEAAAQQVADAEEAKREKISSLRRFDVSHFRLFDTSFLEKMEAIKTILESRIRAIRPGLLADPNAAATATGDAGAAQAAGQMGAAPNALGNRTAALTQLERIANYFLENELHSPIGYALKEIHSWGFLSYPELLRRLGDNLVDDDDHFRKVAKRLRFQWPEDENRY